MLIKRVSYFFLLIIFILVVGCKEKTNRKEADIEYLCSDTNEVILYNENYEEDKIVSRGIKVEIVSKEEDYYKIIYDGINYYVKIDNVSKENIVLEKELYVRTYTSVYNGDNELVGKLDKGSKIDIIGYDSIDSDGNVNKYKIKYNNSDCYVRGKYLVKTKEEAIKPYDYNGSLKIHSSMGTLGGNPLDLDYYPNEKIEFKDNKMPKEVRALYINAESIKNVDNYISLAKEININSFVVDIKDDTTPAYPALAMKKYSKTNYEHAINGYEEYKGYIKKLKDNGFYVIGRITVFKDKYFVKDNPDTAIVDIKTNKPYVHNGSYWPSAYNRKVWMFNVELAKESSKEMGFNEIQFDYTRFPDGIGVLERNKKINLNNKYNESKAQAIQLFLMYAKDELHDINTYISVDVFGEAAHDYVTSYGQYWPSISNVVDVISGMPYPDHFDAHQYGIEEVVWTNPYVLLKYWGSLASKKQKIIPTPAKVRTWIQAYDTWKNPSTTYDSQKVSEEIDGLYAGGLTDGYMTWHSASSINKYRQIGDAFKKERINE